MSGGSLRVMLATFFRWHRKHPVETVQRDLAGLHVVFTGGTDGMGRVAVGRLAQMNAEPAIPRPQPGEDRPYG
ncbi:MAG: hypothetical protein OXH52_17465 [Gammaproteobacteria bacterium]|nr:hypothetical protein [Gammaproteobacteria bacterium]